MVKFENDSYPETDSLCVSGLTGQVWGFDTAPTPLYPGAPREDDGVGLTGEVLQLHRHVPW